MAGFLPLRVSSAIVSVTATEGLWKVTPFLHELARLACGAVLPHGEELPPALGPRGVHIGWWPHGRHHLPLSYPPPTRVQLWDPWASGFPQGFTS